jgi:hypothetical protein
MHRLKLNADSEFLVHFTVWIHFEVRGDKQIKKG